MKSCNQQYISEIMKLSLEKLLKQNNDNETIKTK